MATLAELEAELIASGVAITPGTLTGKADVASKWNGYLTDGETKLTQAQKALQDAQNLQRVIDENIASNGLNETNMAQLRASNAAMSAALAEVKKAGFTGITIPDFQVSSPASTNPIDDLKKLIVSGFTTAGQMQNVATRYMRATGQPLPDDPTALADEAAARRLDPAVWADQKYGLTALEHKKQADATATHEASIAAKAVAAYKEANPSTAGNPELNGGGESRHSNIPKVSVSDAKSVRELASMPERQKIAVMMKRSIEANSQATRGVA